MQLQVLLIVLASLQLSSTQECYNTEVTVLTKNELIQELQTQLMQNEQLVQQALDTNLKGIAVLVNQLLPLQLLGTYGFPAASCRQIKDNNPSRATSGYYWISDAVGQAIEVYCDLESTFGGVTGGWMRVAGIDMRDSSHTCPSGLDTLQEDSKRLCSMNIDGAGCSSVTIATHGVQYSHVYGKIIGYQQKSPDGFEPYHLNTNLTIDDLYVDGISLTHGASPRKHIWTFVIAVHELSTAPQRICPCTDANNTNITINIPPFVGNDYFCDSGTEVWSGNILYVDDPLWDGAGCGPGSSCCSFNNPPWFSKQLTSPTTDDIEMRLCADENRVNEDITIEQVELYVQ